MTGVMRCHCSTTATKEVSAAAYQAQPSKIAFLCETWSTAAVAGLAGICLATTIAFSISHVKTGRPHWPLGLPTVKSYMYGTNLWQELCWDIPRPVERF